MERDPDVGVEWNLDREGWTTGMTEQGRVTSPPSHDRFPGRGGH